MQQKPNPDDAVSVGRVLGLHGAGGLVRVQVFSDDPHRFEPGRTVFCDDTPLVISSAVTRRPQRLIVGFDGVDSPAAATPLVGQWLTIPESWVAELPEGEYFHFQLLGLKVVTDSGEFLGEIVEVIETGSNDVYVVSGDGGQVLIPAIASVVKDVRVETGLMVVRLMEGMR